MNDVDLAIWQASLDEKAAWYQALYYEMMSYIDQPDAEELRFKGYWTNDFAIIRSPHANHDWPYQTQLSAKIDDEALIVVIVNWDNHANEGSQTTNLMLNDPAMFDHLREIVANHFNGWYHRKW